MEQEQPSTLPQASRIYARCILKDRRREANQVAAICSSLQAERLAGFKPLYNN